jgi:valyl-tRNA synthetase
MAKEKERLTKELEKTKGEIARLVGKLSNAGFVAKAPAAVVEAEKAKLQKYEETAAGIEAALAKIN